MRNRGEKISKTKRFCLSQQYGGTVRRSEISNDLCMRRCERQIAVQIDPGMQTPDPVLQPISAPLQSERHDRVSGQHGKKLSLSRTQIHVQTRDTSIQWATYGVNING